MCIRFSARISWATLVAAVGASSCTSEGDPSVAAEADGGAAGAEGGAGSGPVEAGAQDASDATQPDAAPPSSFTRYGHDTLRSPISEFVATSLRGLRENGSAPNDRVFMKVGASGTITPHFMNCLAGVPSSGYEIDLGGRDDLQETITYFRATEAAGTTSFDRLTLAAESGRTASWVQSGSPSPLDREIAAINPRFALVNYGTNDMNMAVDHRAALFPFYSNLSRLLDHVSSLGILPILTGLNPRTDSSLAALWVPAYNTVIRGVAEARQIPYINLFLASGALPDRGLVSDGIHGNTYFERGLAQPCLFTPEGLEFNYNVRNFLTLEALHSTRKVVLGSEAAPDPSGSGYTGDGSPANPFVVDRLPFTHAGNTHLSPHRDIDSYPACDSGQNEAGPEIFYRIDVSAPTPLRLIVLDEEGVDLDVHLLGQTGAADSCTARHDRIIERTLAPGTYVISVDTFTGSDGTPLSGPYLFVAMACESGDSDCT